MAYHIFRTYPLDPKVLAVCVIDGTYWTAYIGAVDGKNHKDEELHVKENGTKLPQYVAEVLFPDASKDFEWRD
jgi:hypothetical protein